AETPAPKVATASSIVPNMQYVRFPNISNTLFVLVYQQKSWGARDPHNSSAHAELETVTSPTLKAKVWAG
ncbi:MAG: hypothetical protein CMB26_05625, partial [Euryarchaeota archaeon]|nr:hypothetical protein [Euryarchaeota archaeon]